MISSAHFVKSLCVGIATAVVTTLIYMFVLGVSLKKGPEDRVGYDVLHFFRQFWWQCIVLFTIGFLVQWRRA